MSALLDAAYEATMYYSHRDPMRPEAIAAIADVYPGSQESDYVAAYESARHLKELALDLADRWWSRHFTEIEARDRLMRECPGFSEETYTRAWSQAANFIWR